MDEVELRLYSGEPTDEELTVRARSGNQQVGYKLPCPNCGRDDTQFLRNSYWMCFQCLIWFTTQDAQGYYDVQAYQQDERIPEELL